MKKQQKDNRYYDIGVDELLNESSSSNEEDLNAKYGIKRTIPMDDPFVRKTSATENQRIKKMILRENNNRHTAPPNIDDDNPFKDLDDLNENEVDMKQIEADLAQKYNIGISSSYQSKLEGLSESDDSDSYQYKNADGKRPHNPQSIVGFEQQADDYSNPGDRQMRIDELCKSSSSSDGSVDSTYKRESIFYKEQQVQKQAQYNKSTHLQPAVSARDDYQFQQILESSSKKLVGQTAGGPISNEENTKALREEITKQSIRNLGFDIDKELEKHVKEENEGNSPFLNIGPNRDNQEEQIAKNTNILEVIEKNEKMNEAIPDKMMEQANQLLSFDNKFYNTKKNKLMIYHEYPAIAAKLHKTDHKYCGMVMCIQLLKNFLFVGNSQGIIRVFDVKSQKEMKPLMDANQVKNESVKCMDINGEAGLLLCGYKNGSIALWDLHDYKLLKFLPNVHDSDVTQVNMYNISNNGGQIQGVSCEDQGAVKLFDITKKAIFGGYNFSSEYLFKNKMVGTTQIAAFQSSNRYPHQFCDSTKLVAFGALNIITICTMKPIDCIYTISKPKFCKKKALPYIDWGFGLTPSQRDKTVPILAFAWDRIIQLIYINDEGTSLEIDGFYYSEKEIIGLFFVGDSILYGLFETRDGRESKILYTTKFFPGTYKTLEEFSIDTIHNSEFDKVASVTMHSELEKTFEVQQVRSQVLKVSDGTHNYSNSLKKYGQNILFLGRQSIQIGRLFSWKEYVEHIKFEEGYDWLGILKVALDIYNGDLKGYSQVSDEKEVRELELRTYMQDLIKSTIQNMIYKFQHRNKSSLSASTSGELDSSSSTSHEIQADSIAIKVAIDFCLNIGITKFLFTDIFHLFVQYNLKEKFIQNMEPFIISGQFQSHHIPEEILSKFLELYECKSDYALQHRKLERIIQKLDVQNYSSDMKAKLEILCQSNCMVSALLYLQGFENHQQGDSYILTTMFKIMRQVGAKEKKQQQHGSVLYTKSDIQMLFIVDQQKKYDIEKSQCYIAYKLLWIIKLYLEGRQFPYGSLSQEKWEKHVLRISTLVLSDDFLNEFLHFDSECFFSVIQKLFYGDPYYFLQQVQKLQGPTTILKKLERTVTDIDIEKRMKKIEKLKQQMDDRIKQDYNLHTIKETMIMCYYYKLIMKIHFQHHQYQTKLAANPVTIKNPYHKFQVKQLAPPALQLDEHLVIDCIIRYLKHQQQDGFDKKIQIKLEEETVLNSLKLCTSVDDQMISELLLLIEQQGLDDYLVYVKIYLLEQQANYLQSFTLNMSQQDTRNNIFPWIEDKFSKLTCSLDTDDQLKQLKNAVASKMRSIIEVDVEKTIELIDKWYDGDYSDQLIVRELSDYPDVQYKFLIKFLLFNEDVIKLVINQSNIVENKKHQCEKYISYLRLFVKLLCQLQDEQEGVVTQELLEAFVKKDYYPIDDCLEICKQYNQHRAIAALCERQRNFVGAIESYMEHLNHIPMVLIGCELSSIVLENHKEKQKKKYSSYSSVRSGEALPSTEELIRIYGLHWDYEECHKSRVLTDFDKTVQKACDLSKNAFEKDQDEEKAWFQILLRLDSSAGSVGKIFAEEKAQYQLMFQRLYEMRLNTHDVDKMAVGLINDFILKRKNSILMKQVPLSIPPLKLMDELNLDLRSIRSIFDFKVQAIKGEKKFIKIANKIIMKEIFIFSDMAFHEASHGYILNTKPDHDLSSYGILGIKMDMQHVDKICQICENKLIARYKSPIKVYIGCGHTFHNHCINSLVKELTTQNEDSKNKTAPGAQCPKCVNQNTAISFQQIKDARSNRGVSFRDKHGQPQQSESRDQQSNQTSSKDQEYLNQLAYTQSLSDQGGKDMVMELKLSNFDAGLNDYQSIRFND